jgi:hypothetical protein
MISAALEDVAHSAGGVHDYSGALRIRIADLGILPLLASLPFMYFPKILEGDTQPWVFIMALIAFFSFRTRTFVRRSDFALIAVAGLCAVAYAVRSDVSPELVRALYMQSAFVVFWLVCRREKGEFFPTAVRITVLLWFVVGVYQFIAVNLDLPVAFIGRYVEGRSGVPSLASEPSIYASLSMLQMMYLLSERNAKNGVFVACAAISVVLSGSILGFLMLIFPFMRLRKLVKIAVLIALVTLVLSDYALTSMGLLTRFSLFSLDSSNLVAALLDPSLNLRLGHIYFTLHQHLVDSLLLLSPVDFMAQYNSFAAGSPIFIQTGNNMILPAIGELIYGSGLAGVILLVLVFHRAWSRATTIGRKIEKVAFLSACLLNPIPLSNIFLVLYAQQES